MRIVKIFFFVLAAGFINVLLFLQGFHAYSKWTKETGRFNLREVYADPFQKIRSFHLPGHESDFLFGLKDTEPEYQRLFFFSPFHKTHLGVSVLLDLTIPKGMDYTNFHVIDNFNKNEPVLPLLGVEKGKLVFELRDIIGKTSYRKILENLSLPIPDGIITIKIESIEDVFGDGQKDLVSSISSDRLGLPRGIFAHDIVSGKKKWEFLFGSIPSGLIVKDINHDGKKEIVFSAWAPHNGISYNGMDDDTSYVGVLDCKGKPLWLHKTGGYYSKEHIAVEDLDLNGTFEVITARSCHRDYNPDPGRIRIYESETGKTLHTVNYPGLSFTTLFVTNMDNDPDREIISCDTKGHVRIWDKKLNTLSEFNGDSDIKIIGVEKMNEDSFPLIFTWYTYNTLRIFDNRLKIIFNLRFPKTLTHPYVEPVIRVSNGKSTFIVLTAGSTYLLSMRQKSLTLQDYLPLLLSPFSLYLLGVFVLNGFLYLGWRQRKNMRNHYLELIKKEPGANLEWTVTAQEALHKMKSPLTAILWETEKIDALLGKKRQSKTSWTKLKAINEAILDDLNELKLMNHFLMKFLQVQTLHLREIDIKELIIQLTDKYQSNLAGRFTFALNFSNPLPLLLGDEERLKEVLSIVIDNAADAKTEGGFITISTVYYKILPGSDKKNIICIEIEDNGGGIPPDQLERIFDPYYTTKKEGTGIGLAIARRIVESHNGWLKVDSRPGIGTKFALYFPVKSFTN